MNLQFWGANSLGDFPETDRFFSAPLPFANPEQFSTSYLLNNFTEADSLRDDVGQIHWGFFVGRNLVPSDECMQKDALRHKVPELSRGFPWMEKLLRCGGLLFFWSTLEDARGKRLEKQLLLLHLVENRKKIHNLGNHHTICWMMKSCKPLGQSGPKVTENHEHFFGISGSSATKICLKRPRHNLANDWKSNNWQHNSSTKIHQVSLSSKIS